MRLGPASGCAGGASDDDRFVVRNAAGKGGGLIKYYSKNAAGLRLPLDDPDFRLLRVFRAVVECGGVSAAEETLGIGRSTISTRLSALEKRLNVRLCERGRKGFRLTEEGKVVYDAILDLWQAAEHFKDRTASVQEGLMGELSICTLDHAVTDPNNPVPEAIDRFKRRSDSVTVSIDVAPPLEVERTVGEGRAHVGITASLEHRDGLYYKDLYPERSQLYCGDNHPLFERAPEDVAKEEVARSDWVGPASFGVPGGAIGFRDPPGASALHIEGELQLILTGRYLGYLPVHCADPWVRRGELRPILPDQVFSEPMIKLITRRSRTKQPEVMSAFIEDLFAVL